MDTGGLELAVAAASALPTRTLWHAEVDPDASATLARHWPDAPNLGDIRHVDWSRAERPDVLALGVPCQAVSAAGRQQVESDPRWLGPEPAAYRCVRALLPDMIVFENVANLVSIRGGEVWRAILTDLRVAGYAVAWTILGACYVGAPHHRHRVFAVARRRLDLREPVRVGVKAFCGAPRRGSAVLPSPMARDGDGRGEGDPDYWERRTARTGRTHGMPLGAAVNLLPSPRGSDAKNSGPNQGITADDSAISPAVHVERWGRYAAAVERWERLVGRPAPAPTEPTGRGEGQRLAPALPEWMMGLDDGWLTGHLGRAPALRLAGNGVCPQQGEAAIRMLHPACGSKHLTTLSRGSSVCLVRQGRERDRGLK